MFKSTTEIVFFLISGGSAALGNMLLKAGMNKLTNIDFTLPGIVPTLIKMFSQWQVFLGFCLYGISSIIYLKVITGGEVTKIYPAIVSYMFILLLILGTVFLKESLTFTKILGIIIIIAGIFVAGR